MPSVEYHVLIRFEAGKFYQRKVRCEQPGIGRCGLFRGEVLRVGQQRALRVEDGLAMGGVVG